MGIIYHLDVIGPEAKSAPRRHRGLGSTDHRLPCSVFHTFLWCMLNEDEMNEDEDEDADEDKHQDADED